MQYLSLLENTLDFVKSSDTIKYATAMSKTKGDKSLELIDILHTVYSILYMLTDAVTLTQNE
jgi:hypothetical protein